MDLVRKIFVIFLLCISATSLLAAPIFSSLLPGAQQVGQGVFKRFGWSIYEARLYAQSDRFDASKPFALSLTYARTIDSDRLVQSSLDEMRKLGQPVDERPQWAGELSKVLPSVSKGVTLTGVYRPGEGATFYEQDRKIGQISEALARAFFAIWLDPRTSEPALRQSLLGLKQ